MTDRVKVRQAIGTVDVPAGTEQWLDDDTHVAAMCQAGFWHVVDRVPGKAPRGRRVPADEQEVKQVGETPVEPDGVPG